MIGVPHGLNFPEIANASSNDIFLERNMKHSTDRILTPHAGRLDGPPELAGVTRAFRAGSAPDLAEIRPKIHSGMVDVIRRQAEAGIDIVSDGELGKIGLGGIGHYRKRRSRLSTRRLREADAPLRALRPGARTACAD